MADTGAMEGPNDFELMHQIVPGESGRDHTEEMAETYIIELKRMWWSNEAILQMFRNPFYAGPHQVYRDRGEGFICDLLERCRTNRERRTLFEEDSNAQGL